MNLTSSLELRASSCVAATALLDGNVNGLQKNTHEVNGHGVDLKAAHATNGVTNHHGFDLINCVDELIASAELIDLQSNRGFFFENKV